MHGPFVYLILIIVIHKDGCVLRGIHKGSFVLSLLKFNMLMILCLLALMLCSSFLALWNEKTLLSVNLAGF